MTSNSTPIERRIAAWAIIVVLTGVGLTCHILAWQASAAQAAAAAKLHVYGWGFLGAALVAWIIYRALCWIVDR